MPSRCRVLLLVIAIATALCLAGIPVGPVGSQPINDSGPASVQLTSPAGHAPGAVRVTRAEDGTGFVSHLGASVAPQTGFRPSERSPRPLPAYPPVGFRDALRALPLIPRAPPLA